MVPSQIEHSICAQRVTLVSLYALTGTFSATQAAPAEPVVAELSTTGTNYRTRAGAI